MKLRILFAALACGALLAPSSAKAGWMGKWKKSGEKIATIQAHDLQDLMEKEGSDLIVINVLDEKYFKDCSIDGSIHVPIDQLEQWAQDKSKDHAQIVVYCAHSKCPLSRHAYAKLKKMGFVHVQAYEGGMKEWKSMKFACVGNCKEEYLTSTGWFDKFSWKKSDHAKGTDMRKGKGKGRKQPAIRRHADQGDDRHEQGQHEPMADQGNMPHSWKEDMVQASLQE